MNAVNRNQQGSSLIELLVAASVGLLVILAVTSLFLKAYNSTAQRSLELMLHQDVNDALRMIKEDILRAGYQSGASGTLKLSGAIESIAVNNDKNCIAIAYINPEDKATYRSFRFAKAERKIKVYQSDNVFTLSDICKESGAYSLLYDKQINATRFTIENIPIGLSSGVRSQIIKIGLSAELKNDSSYKVEKEVTIKVRNWSAG